MEFIGFIGLGDQGGPIAEKLLQAGQNVSVWARRAEAAAAYRALGAEVSVSAAELAARSHVLALCVTGDNDVRELAGNGVLAAMRPGSVLMIHSTIYPETCRDLAREGARRGVSVVDAPVSGSAARARAGTLVTMLGGDAAAVARMAPLVSIFSDPVVIVGAAGSAMTAKLVNNLMAAVNYATAYDALALGAGNGVPGDVLREIALTGSGRNYGFDLMPRAHRPERAAHIARILGKDVDLALAALPGVRESDLGRLALRAIAIIEGFARGEGLLVTPQSDAEAYPQNAEITA